MTGSHLKVKALGDNVQGVVLEGNPRKPEHAEFRVMFPGGSVSVCRCTDGSYWAHVAVDHPEHPMFVPGEDEPARLVDARLDIVGRHTSEVNIGEFADPNLYHLAVRVERRKL